LGLRCVLPTEARVGQPTTRRAMRPAGTPAGLARSVGDSIRISALEQRPTQQRSAL